MWEWLTANSDTPNWLVLIFGAWLYVMASVALTLANQRTREAVMIYKLTQDVLAQITNENDGPAPRGERK